MTDDSALYGSYGEFRNSADWMAAFPDFNGKQKESATHIVDRILEHCDGTNYRFPQIKYLVDLGCGDGALAVAILQSLASNEAWGKRGHSVDYIGLETDDGMRYAAEAAVKQFDKARVVKLDDPNACPFSALPEGHAWDETCLLVLSHTWFHLSDQDSLLTRIAQHRPALLLVDVYRTWDHVLKTLETQEFYDEELRTTDNGYLFSLRTVRLNAPSDTSHRPVARGLFRRTSLSAQESGQWLFKTIQNGIGTESLRPVPPDTHLEESKWETACNTLTEMDGAGGLTGQGQYLVLDEFEHPSGWGDMRCIVMGAMAPRDPKGGQHLGGALNAAYFTAVHALIDTVFIRITTDPALKGLRDLIGVYQRAFAAVILPFDPLRAYAQFVPVRRHDSPDSVSAALLSAVEKCLLLVDELNRHQCRLPTAQWLYYTLLAPVSGPLAFPFPVARLPLADKCFKVLEGELLKASLPTKTDNKHSASETPNGELSAPTTAGLRGEQATAPTTADAGGEQAPASAFFIIPFYDGAMPVFALFLEVPAQFPVTSTNAQTFSALAENLDSQLTRVLDPELLRTLLIRPFVRGFLASHPKPDFEFDATKLEKLWDDAAMSERRPWKSWVRALPSLTLSQLPRAREMTDRQTRVLTAELALAQSDVQFAIATWLKSVGFFSEDCHDSLRFFPIARARGERLVQFEKLAAIADCEPAQLASAEKLLPLFLAGSKDKTSATTVHFLAKLFGEMSGALKERATNEALDVGEEAFKALKVLFHIQQDWSFSFSFARLLGSLFATIPDNPSILPMLGMRTGRFPSGHIAYFYDLERNSPTHGPGTTRPGSVQGDPTADILTLFHFLSKAKALTTIEFSDLRHEGSTWSCQFSIFTTALDPQRREGQDAAPFFLLVRQHAKPGSTTDTAFFQDCVSTLQVNCVADINGLRIEWTIDSNSTPAVNR